MSTCLTIRRPDDFHVHFREGEELRLVVPQTAGVFARALVMSNTKRPIRNGADIVRYREEILEAGGDLDFAPLMTFKITPETSFKDVASAKDAGAVAGKLYPDGVTTGSEGGVRDFRALDPIFGKMSDLGLVLSIHGECPDSFCLDREEDFLPILKGISRDFPDLRIVMEHLSTAKAINAILDLPNVAGTITAHHLELTLDNVIGGLLMPHNFCKPIAKREEDRQALLTGATSGNPKLVFGSDSALHLRTRKECAEGCAGVYSAPVALPLLAEIFERHDALEKLEPFVSEFGARFYNLPLNNGEITLVREPWQVRQEHPDLVPYKLGHTLSWQVASS